jgi:hypothetical protein
VILLGPSGIGKTHLAIGLGVAAARALHPVRHASNWITRLSEAHHAGRLEAELKKIRRYRSADALVTFRSPMPLPAVPGPDHLTSANILVRAESGPAGFEAQ